MIPILYSFRRCPYAMRARLALSLSGITVELREIVLKRKPACMLKLSPKGTVPVLKLDNTIIDESLDIMHWALGDNIFTEVESKIINDNDGAFKLALDRYKYYNREELVVEGKSALDFRSEALIYLNTLDHYISLHIADTAVSRFECAILPFVRQFRGVDPDWFDHLPFATLHKRLQNFLNSSLFAKVMCKFPEWEIKKEPLLVNF